MFGGVVRDTPAPLGVRSGAHPLLALLAFFPPQAMILLDQQEALKEMAEGAQAAA